MLVVDSVIDVWIKVAGSVIVAEKFSVSAQCGRFILSL